MADIATFRCSNRQCLLTFHAAHDFPVWDEARTTIVRRRFETFCEPCNKVVEYADGVCTVCATEVVVDNVGRACPRCTTGSFTMPYLSAVVS